MTVPTRITVPSTLRFDQSIPYQLTNMTPSATNTRAYTCALRVTKTIRAQHAHNDTHNITLHFQDTPTLLSPTFTSILAYAYTPDHGFFEDTLELLRVALHPLECPGSHARSMCICTCINICICMCAYTRYAHDYTHVNPIHQEHANACSDNRGLCCAKRVLQ